MAGSVDEEALHQLYLWVDNIPLSRPKRNLSRDFSDGGAEQAELLGTRGRDAQDCPVCPGRGGAGAHSTEAAPGGTAEAHEAGHGLLTGATQVKLLPLLWGSCPGSRKPPLLAISVGEGCLAIGSLAWGITEVTWGSMGMGSLSSQWPLGVFFQELAPQDGTDYMDVGLSQKAPGEGAPDPQGGGQLRRGRLPAPRPPGYTQALQGDPSFVLQIAEKEQELLASQETVQVLQMKVRRLEHLLQLKNVRIEDLSRRLQQVERKQR
uniref:Sperm flagellar 1 n=1 Tax=Equus caballus TaxID=9796 RepID=F6S0V8_HORSE